MNDFRQFSVLSRFAISLKIQTLISFFIRSYMQVLISRLPLA